jgi:hypothetical protein
MAEYRGISTMEEIGKQYLKFTRPGLNNTYQSMSYTWKGFTSKNYPKWVDAEINNRFPFL